MRIAPAAAAASAILISLAVTGTAGAADNCVYPSSAYSTGKPWFVENPGAQPVNDPVFPAQWGLPMIKAPTAWARGARGGGVTVAVLDTGTDLSHPDLRANLVPGKDFTPSAKQGCPGPQDENGHGTHVSGIVAASTNNGIGVAGTAPRAKVMPLRVLDADGGGDDPTIIRAMRHAADNGAKVINLSLGGLPLIGNAPQFNSEIAQAAAYAYSKGALVVAAAGNESMPLCSYPAAASKAVCVAAVDRRGMPSAYSNFPQSMEDSVGVRAPGGSGDQLDCEGQEDIWSTIWPEGEACNDTSRPENPDLAGYEAMAGTSMASPFVAGVAAVLSARGLSNGQILQCLKTTSSKNGAYDPVMGYGIVNLDAATRRCSASSTPVFRGGGTSGGATGGKRLVLRVSHRRIRARRLARKRRMKVRVRSNRRVTVRLRAVARRRGKTVRRLGTRRVRLARAGKRTVKLRIKRRAARWLKRHKRAKIRVRYRGGGRKGWAKVTRR